MKLLLSLVLLIATSAQAEVVHDCVDTEAYNYCISKTVGSKSREVLYILHGGGGNEFVWKDSTYEDLRTELEKKGGDAPAVITVSFGRIWLLVKKNENPRSGLLELFTKEIMPELELKAVGGPAQRRQIIGHSMGGFNGAQLILHSPVGTFARAALLCPAFVDISPFSSKEEREALAKKLEVPLDAVDNIADIASAFVPNNEVWYKYVSPIDLAARLLGPDSTEILVAGNKEDKLFLQGGEIFAQVVKATGAPVTWELWEGDHCDADAAATKVLADFLQR